jgi:hypothetical protein
MAGFGAAATCRLSGLDLGLSEVCCIIKDA